MDDKECFAYVTMGKSSSKTEVLKHNGSKKSSISKQQQLIESHNSEVKLELLDDIGLDLK